MMHPIIPRFCASKSAKKTFEEELQWLFSVSHASRNRKPINRHPALQWTARTGLQTFPCRKPAYITWISSVYTRNLVFHFIFQHTCPYSRLYHRRRCCRPVFVLYVRYGLSEPAWRSWKISCKLQACFQAELASISNSRYHFLSAAWLLHIYADDVLMGCQISRMGDDCRLCMQHCNHYNVFLAVLAPACIVWTD